MSTKTRNFAATVSRYCNREITKWFRSINMNIITVGSYPRCNIGLECDFGVTCIDELVCNLFGGERCSS